MKFALIDGERREAQPGLSGTCPGCGEAVTAKCGTIRVWHWAHKGRLTCDPWWESETAWHRTWKNRFPTSWQEVVHVSESTGERHIADIRTPHGLVMEFQHSAITREERTSRERFYVNMIWIVDGTRLKNDRPRIDANLPGWHGQPEGDVQMSPWAPEVFPKRWLDCTVPVLFDFDGLHVDRAGFPLTPLVCLLPSRFRGRALYFPVARSSLQKVAEGGAVIFDWRRVHASLESAERALRTPRRRARF